jgi:hypothetical protein
MSGRSPGCKIENVALATINQVLEGNYVTIFNKETFPVV